MSLFVEDEVDTFDPLKTIYDFIQFVDRICVVALQVGPLFLVVRSSPFKFRYKDECLLSTECKQCLLKCVVCPVVALSLSRNAKERGSLSS